MKRFTIKCYVKGALRPISHVFAKNESDAIEKMRKRFSKTKSFFVSLAED